MSITPGEELLIKIWETLEKGVTGLIRPWQGKRVGKALNDVKADEIKKLLTQKKTQRKSEREIFLLIPKERLSHYPNSQKPYQSIAKPQPQSLKVAFNMRMPTLIL